MTGNLASSMLVMFANLTASLVSKLYIQSQNCFRINESIYFFIKIKIKIKLKNVSHFTGTFHYYQGKLVNRLY